MKAMRFAARALVAVFLVVGCREVVAAEPGSGWWPFGHHDEAAVSQSQGVAASSSPLVSPPPAGSGPIAHAVQLPQTSPDASPDSHWMADTPKSKVNWPKLHMPELPKPHLPKTGSLANKPKPDTSRNVWAEKTPAAPKSSPMQSVKNGAHRVTAGTKTAWHKTVAALSPGDKSKKTSGSQVARREVQPPLWKRMFGAKEPELQQPQTIPQWMAQKRLDP